MPISAAHPDHAPESALILKASVFYTTVAIVAVVIVLCVLL